MKRTLIFIFSLASIITVLPLQAQGWYQVEVIVFDYLDPDLDRELWFENPGLPQRDDSIEVIQALPDAMEDMTVEINQRRMDESTGLHEDETPVREMVPFMALPEANYRLKDIYRNLRLSSTFRPLLHIAWQQPALDSSRIRYIHLEKLVSDEQKQIEIQLQQPGQQVIEERYDPPKLYFDGKVRIRVADIYLYADVDFAYFPEDFTNLLNVQLRNAGSQYDELVNYDADYVRLSQSRRINLNDLEYFDHPLFGILLQVSRIEQGS